MLNFSKSEPDLLNYLKTKTKEKNIYESIVN